MAIMISKLRQAKRINDYIPVEVTVQNAITGKPATGPFSGEIINISHIGSCLLMSQVMIGSYHIFHSTRENDALFLQLTIDLPPDIVDCKISARPIWMNLFHQDEVRAFKMGLEFRLNTVRERKRVKKLLAAIALK
jgi:hypothetical protein